ncbi:MAG: TlpA family protein disulfide reductase [Bryobacteraceae bacterium]|nr:TlpA family protein disulfide reductase [Bryobacteraceae bacterium]
MERRALLALGAGGMLAHAQQIPRLAEFEFTTTDGPLKLSQHRGKTVVLAMIRSSCQHCQQTTQLMRSLQAEFGPKVQMLACDFVEDGPIVVPTFIDRFKPGFPVGWTTIEKAFKFLQVSLMNPGTVPKLVFIDKKGMVRAQYDGGDPAVSGEGNQREKLRAKIAEVIAL